MADEYMVTDEPILSDNNIILEENIQWINNYNHGFRYFYTIDEDNKIITCTMEARYNGENVTGMDTFLYNRIGHELLKSHLNAYIPPVFNMKDKLVFGRAYCLPEDEWNEEIGKKIAYHKALKKLSDRRIKELEILHKYYQTVINTITDITTQQTMTFDLANKIITDI